MQTLLPGGEMFAERPPKSAGHHRIFLDCTETVRLRANTGIQRAVRSIVGEGARLGTSTFECVPIVFNGRHFVGLDAGEIPGPFSCGEDRSTWRERVRRMVTSGSQFSALRASILHPAIIGIVRQGASSLHWSLARLFSTQDSVHKPIEFSDSDWIVLLDSTWEPDLRPELIRAKAAGAQVCVMIYDLIKIRTPELAPPGATAIFKRWLARSLPLADRVITISRSVREDVLQYLGECGLHAFPAGKVGWIHLGSNFVDANRVEAISADLHRLFGPGHPPSFLVLGTVEPRKSQSTVLDAFELRWRDGDQARLILVGREGWGSQDLIKRLRHHPELGRRMVWLERANDADVEFCFRHSTALINASTSEGFGLPIVEALQRGVPVIASDIAVFREVGGDHVSYFSPGDHVALAHAIGRCELHVPDRQAPPGLPVQSWADTTRSLVEFLIARIQ
jgi:glycosyltransferase involved in cell wall biosynthesis